MLLSVLLIALDQTIIAVRWTAPLSHFIYVANTSNLTRSVSASVDSPPCQSLRPSSMPWISWLGLHRRLSVVVVSYRQADDTRSFVLFSQCLLFDPSVSRSVL